MFKKTLICMFAFMCSNSGLLHGSKPATISTSGIVEKGSPEKNIKGTSEETLVPSNLSDEELTTLIPVLSWLKKQLKPSMSFETLDAVNKRQLLTELNTKLSPFKEERIPALAYAARLIDLRALEQGALWKYATYLHGLGKAAIKKQCDADTHAGGLFADMWPDIARYYYLQFDEEIEPLLWPKQKGKPQKWIYLDFEDLKAYDKFDNGFLEFFPNLSKNPNELTENYGEKNLALVNLLTQRKGSEQELFTKILALLKLRDIDVNATEARHSPLGRAAGHNLLEIAQRLLDAGADPNIVAGDGYSTPLLEAIFHPEMVNLLIKSGASLDHAIKLAEGNTHPSSLSLLRSYLPKK